VSERLRILHCMRAPVGGLFRHVLDLGAEQAARGHDVGLVLDATTSNQLTEQRLSRIAPRLTLGVTRIPMSRLPGIGDFSIARTVRDFAVRRDVDVLHGHGAKGGAYARIARRMLQKDPMRPVAIYTPHGGSLHYPMSSLPGLTYIGIEKMLARCTDGLIFESDFMRRRYEERVGKDVAPTQVITNALQPADFTPHEPDYDAADFLFVGELRKLKGVDVLLHALSRIAQKRPVRAVIVGSGPDEEEFKRLADELGLADATEFPGALPAAQAFRRGRCIVVPSLAESLPYIVLEAAAAEMPMIATNVGGIPEIIGNADTSLLPPGDVPALVRAMHDFLIAPKEAKARAQRLRAAVGARFSIATTTTAVLRFYDSLVLHQRLGAVRKPRW